MSMSVTTSTPTSGCKLSFLIPLLLALCFILFLVALSRESSRYATPVHEFSGTEGGFFRVEGILNQGQICDETACIPAVFLKPNSSLKDGTSIIVEGTWVDGHLLISDVLTKCH